MVQLSRPLTAAETATARRVIEERTDLVTVGFNWDLPPWGGTADFAVLAVLAGVALLALVLNLLLARTQLRGDLVTMHAVGASPRFLRRLMAAHAAVVLALGVPAGAVCGWAVAAYVVLWNRHVLLEGPCYAWRVCGAGSWRAWPYSSPWEWAWPGCWAARRAAWSVPATNRSPVPRPWGHCTTLVSIPRPPRGRGTCTRVVECGPGSWNMVNTIRLRIDAGVDESRRPALTASPGTRPAAGPGS
ncbi:FtsX-like permease family protein [Actinomyces ruminis]|uniref:ABC3 transporter permease C-terminal domain-containing protein n=1 Tax=Actinomyces ruminis TaxID=1937003 RepID=A0ABX4MBZ0_9ACTO|nr:FtsX-like permease family protein [Actinomyces ruminis]PHP53008.1 hypothetical protein BW737_005750 [Actinomyces ruminis]